MEEAVDALNSAQNDFSKQKAEKDAQSQKVLADCTSAKLKIEELTSEKCKVESEAAQLRAQCDGQSVESATKSGLIKNLEVKIAALSEQMATQNDDLEAKSAEVIEFAMQLEQVVDQGEEWKRKCHLVEETNSATGAQSADRISRLQKDLDTAAVESKLIQKELQTAHAELKSTAEMINSITEEKDEIASSFQTFQGQVASLNASTVTEKTELQSKIDALTTDLSSIKGQLNEQQTDNAALYVAGNQARDQIEKLTVALTEATSKIELATSKSTTDEVKLTQLKAECDSLSHNLESKSKLVGEKQTALESLRSQVSEKSVTSESVISQIKVELDEVTTKYEVLQWYVTYSPYYGMF